MTAQHDSISGANAENGQGAVSPSTPIPARRRMLVRGAAAALPTILTLRSGAALARSSNMMGVADGSSADGGVYRCVDELSVTRRGSQLDLNEPPSADVTVIRADGVYFKKDGTGPVTGPEMCQTGGTFLNEGGQDVIVNKGALVSATAFTSFIGRASIKITEI